MFHLPRSLPAQIVADVPVFEFMLPTEIELYDRIKAFRLDDSEALIPFSVKLVWEYRWSQIYTLRVIQEYKKFIFLVMVADHIVSPSAPVDRVWHLHMLYTRSYWNDFCGQVLQKPLHHSPSLGGKEEALKYAEFYRLTLETYQRYFGVPPEDIWHLRRPRNEIFRYQWIDRDQHWVIPNPFYCLRDWFSLKFLPKRLIVVFKLWWRLIMNSFY
jgi:hypothetical protein